MKNKINYSLCLVSALLITSCARERAPEATRSIVSPVEPLAQFEGLETVSSASACEHLDSLATLPSAETTSNSFSVLSKVEFLNQQPIGAIQIDSNPFFKLILADRVRVPTEKEFIKIANGEHRAGRLSWTKLALLKGICAVWDSKCRKTITEKTSEKVAVGFPGVFAKIGPLENSLPYGLLQKFLGHKPTAEELKILTKRIPLFVSSDWSEQARETKKSTEAIRQAIRLTSRQTTTASSSEDSLERTCAFTLIQRSFSQLLTIKGYQGVKTERARGSDFSTVLPLKEFDTQLASQEYPGSYLGKDDHEPVVLKPEDISTFVANSSPFSLSQQTPLESGSQSSAGVSAQLGYLEMMTQLYGVTSPASFADKDAYFLGSDISSKDGKAILPYEAHTLAMGLFGMGFKNVAANGMSKINSRQAVMGEGESAAGIMIFDNTQIRSPSVIVRMIDVASLTRSAVNLTRTLGEFKMSEAQNYASIHPYYSFEKLVGLAGSAMMDDLRLAQMVPSSTERDAMLSTKLKQLHLPLALALSKFSKQNESCASEIEWNPATGEQQAIKRCDDSESQILRDAKRSLGKLVRSPVLTR